MNQVMKIQNFIDGEWLNPRAGHYIENRNPATDEIFSKIPDSGPEDVELAVLAAKKAFPEWAKKSDQERASILYRIADLIEKRKDEFAAMESRDQGKTVDLALKMDISRAVLNFRFFAGAILHQEGQSAQTDENTINYVLKKPIGVAGLISPWNLPLYLATWKIAPAIAVGNTCVLKPSEFTSMTAHLLTEVMKEAGLPSGVVNVVYGTGPHAGEPLVKHPDVPVVSFTGGTETGRKIGGWAGSLNKKLSLELGGKNPTIVFADCDLDKAIPHVLRASFLNQGEICLCGSRIYVEEKIYKQFLHKLTEQALMLKVGDPSQTGTFLGPLVSRAHRDKVKSYIDLAIKEGGKVECGGQIPKLSGALAKGYFIEPTILTGLKEESRCIQEEIFGPVVTVSKFSTEEEALEKANGVKYGLSAAVFTQDIGKANRMARNLDVGTVWINTWLLRDLRMPFGGMKASGIGREGGKHSIDFFTESTTVCVRT